MQSIATHHPDIAAILHVGDIYDSGYYDSEVQPHFIKPIRDTFQQAKLSVPPVFAVPGDHEYHSGGAGFFQMITGEVDGTKVCDPINGKDPALQQQASYFCLRTKSGSWQFLGADTGFTSGDFPQPGIDSKELVWHQDKVENFKGKTVFLTHRQFVSAYEKLDTGANSRYNIRLVNDMKDLLSRRQNGDEKTSLMLWGHEHRFVPYVDGLRAPGYATPIGAKMRLLGGSARETGSSSPRDPSLVMKDKSGTPISTRAVNPGKIQNPRTGVYDDVIFSNHSYAIVDLEAAKASYFEVTAWDGTTPLPFIQLTQPPALVDDAL
jgi:predicted phosphodiesterase